ASEKVNIYCNSIASVDSNIWTATIRLVSRYYEKDMDVIPLQTMLGQNEFAYFAKQIGDQVYIGTPKRLIAKDTRPPYRETIVNNEKFGVLSICKGLNGEILLGSYSNLYKLEN